MRLRRKNTLVFGNYGYKTNQLDGQTMKLRQMQEVLKIKEAPYVVNRDISLISGNLFKILDLFWQIILAKQVFYFAAQRNLRLLFPVMYFVTKLFGVKLHYFAVGGWLAEFIEKLPWHVKKLKRISGVYIEFDTMVDKLEKKYGFQNAFLFPNFRVFPSHIEESSSEQRKDDMKCVFMARIRRDKGVFDLFALEELILKDAVLSGMNISIDLFGYFKEDERADIENLLMSSRIITYKGILKPEEIYNALAHYDLMLFPTYYSGEGLPGTIIDAYISRLPILASDWNYNSELIIDNVTGCLHEPKNVSDLFLKFRELVTDRSKLESIRKEINFIRDNFSEKKAWDILIERKLFSR